MLIQDFKQQVKWQLVYNGHCFDIFQYNQHVKLINAPIYGNEWANGNVYIDIDIIILLDFIGWSWILYEFLQRTIRYNAGQYFGQIPGANIIVDSATKKVAIMLDGNLELLQKVAITNYHHNVNVGSNILSWIQTMLTCSRTLKLTNIWSNIDMPKMCQ